MADRYTVKSHRYLGPGRVTVDGWCVHDSVTRLIAQGTKGHGGRPDGYAHRKDADKVADRLNAAHNKRMKGK